MPKNSTKAKWVQIIIVSLLVIAALAALAWFNTRQKKSTERYTHTGFAMSTIVTQTAYGPGATQAMADVTSELAAFERRLSLFDEGSDIARINTANGREAVAVDARTAEFLAKAVALTPESEGAFAITIAPLTLAWGITTDSPRVPDDSEIEALLPLVDDSAVLVEGNTVTLAREDMAIDLGGIAKGEACTLAKEIYEKNGVDSALLWIGGNTYARGTKPDGTPYRIGFRDPVAGGDAYIASFDMTDLVIAVSDGSERYFTEDGKTFIHILDPMTGRPAESDVLSVGIIHEDGAVADFYSTTLYVWGMERSLEYMRAGGTAILLDGEYNLYVSESLAESFELYDTDNSEYTLHFIPGG